MLFAVASVLVVVAAVAVFDPVTTCKKGEGITSHEEEELRIFSAHAPAIAKDIIPILIPE